MSSSSESLPHKYRKYDEAFLDEDTIRNCKRPQYEQHSQDWYRIRHTLLTASMLADVLRMPKSETALCAYKDYLKQFDAFKKKHKHGYCGYNGLRKAWLKRHHVPWSGGGHACHWGTRFESVANALYVHINKVDVLEYGLMIHPEYPWLGVSPDGITANGIMVEIKCPEMRTITEDGFCSLDYWIQCQLQLEVCDMKKPLHFWQCQFQEYENKEAYLQDEDLNEIELFKGAYIMLNDTDCIYPDYTKVPFNSPEMVQWCEKNYATQMNQWNRMDLEDRSMVAQPEPPKTVYWKTKRIRCTVIERSREWFAAIRPEAEAVFDVMQNPNAFEVDPQEIEKIEEEEANSKKPYYKPRIQEKHNTRSGLPSHIGTNLVKNRQISSFPLKRKEFEEGTCPVIGELPKRFKLPSGIGLNLLNK